MLHVRRFATVAVCALCTLILPAVAQSQHKIHIWLDVAPFEHSGTGHLVTVQPRLAARGLDSLRLLFSATVDVAFDSDRYEYRAGTGGDVSAFVTEGRKACAAKAGAPTDCIGYQPYSLTQNLVDDAQGRARVRTLIYSSLGYDSELGEPGLSLVGDTVTLAALFFARRSSASQTRVQRPQEVPDTTAFRIMEQTIEISIYDDRDEDGNVGEYVDCRADTHRCRLRVFHPPFFRPGEG